MNATNATNAVESVTATSHGTTTVRRSDTIAKLTAAVTKAVAELKNPAKDSVNPFFNCKYADLATVRDAILPVLARHDLAILQLPCELDNAAALTTLLSHTSGEWVETTIKLRPVRNDPQGVGSALTYARRYALQSIAGVAAEDDDDGNAAGRRDKPLASTNGRPTPEAGRRDNKPAGESNGRTSPDAALTGGNAASQREKAAGETDDRPSPSAAALAGEYSQRLAKCRTQVEYAALCQQIKAEVKAKRLTNGDRETLLAVAQETATRFPEAAAANGTSHVG